MFGRRRDQRLVKDRYVLVYAGDGVDFGARRFAKVCQGALLFVRKDQRVIVGFFEEGSSSGLCLVVPVFALVSGPFRFFCLFGAHTVLSFVSRCGYHLTRER